MKEIQCGSVHRALSAIDTSEEDAYLDLDYRLVDFFKEKGLVSAYSTWFYHEMLSNAENLKRAKTRFKTIRQEEVNYWMSINSLEKILKATWSYTRKQIQDMRERLTDKKQKHVESLRAAKNLEERVDKLEAMPAPGDYRLTIDGDYVKLRDKGTRWLKCLSGRLDELGDTPLEGFERVMEDFESRIDTYYSRFIEIVELMGSRGFSKYNQDVIDCAVRLSTIEGTILEVYNRMRTINDFLYNESPYHDGVEHYGRLIPAAAVAMQPENIGMLREELIETYNALVKRGYHENFYAWWLASAMMELNRFDIERNIKRYEDVWKALGKKGWKIDERHICYMAANLARGMDSPEELAREHNTLKNKLVGSGRRNLNDTGTAALILMDGDGTLDERVHRFVKVFEEMKANGWEKHSYFYPVAAVLSGMPHSAAENVMWLDTIIGRLKDDGFADGDQNWDGHKYGLTYRALTLLMAAYKGQFRKELTPSILVHSNEALFKSSK